MMGIEILNLTLIFFNTMREKFRDVLKVMFVLNHDNDNYNRYPIQILLKN